MLLVTGLGRSGTGYAAALLQAHGLDVGHELLGDHGMSSWLAAADDRKQPVGWYVELKRFDTVLHQVRHPLSVVRSWLRINGNVFRWACERAGIEGAWSDIDARALLWLRWNEIALERADHTFRVEDVLSPATYRRWCDAVGVEPNPAAARAVPTNTNTRTNNRPPVTWADMTPDVRDAVRRAAESYGYIG